MVLKKINDDLCPDKNICDVAGGSANYIIAIFLAIFLDVILPIGYILITMFTTGLLQIGLLILSLVSAIVAWFFLFREIGIYAIIPIVAEIIGIILIFTIIGMLLGVIILFIMWNIVAVIWHWWEHR